MRRRVGAQFTDYKNKTERQMIEKRSKFDGLIFRFQRGNNAARLDS
jgi:hypothetical protein